MAVLKYYDGSDWEPVASALVGPTGAVGVTGATGPTGSDASSGLTLINTTTFSAVASHSVNDVFSSTYDNYKILLRATCTSGGENLLLRFRVGGVDASGATDYKFQEIVGNNTVSGSRTTASSAIIGNTANTATQINSASVDIFSPALATATSYQAFGISNYLSGLLKLNGGNHAVATAYDGFTILTGGSITGTVSVYGFKK
jgi:hypothetical protein